MPYLPTILLFAFSILLLCLIRLRLILPRYASRPLPRPRGTPTRLLIVLGSGGHTAEMLSMLQTLCTRSYTHRTYVVSHGDSFSAQRAVEFEEALERTAREKAIAEEGAARAATKEKKKKKMDTGPQSDGYGSYDIAFVPRARKVHQPLLTTPFSCLRCLIGCLAILRKPSVLIASPSSTLPSHSPNATLTYPHLILLNGPATSLVLVLGALLLRFLGLPGTQGMMRSVFVESWARVTTMSLSGKILVWGGLCERVLVQWEPLAGKGREFRGSFVR